MLPRLFRACKLDKMAYSQKVAEQKGSSVCGLSQLRHNLLHLLVQPSRNWSITFNNATGQIVEEYLLALSEGRLKDT